MIKIKYKLKDIEKQEAVRKLTGYDFDFFNNRTFSGKLECYPVETGTSCYNILNSLGLIDLWFEEVVEDFKVGDYVFLVSNINDYKTHFSNTTEIPVGFLGRVNSVEHSVHPFKKWIFIEGFSEAISANQFRYATVQEKQKYRIKNDLPKIGSYKPEINDHYISYGCIRIEKESLRQVLNAANILSMDIHADGEIITIIEHELYQIKDFLNKGE